MKTDQIPKLHTGDAIALISTARKVNKEELNFAVNIIESWGLNVCYGKNLFEENHQFAGTVEQRTQDLQSALNDE
ncbi:MAG: LD-carboxypeptidase, partial [Flavobacteriales bacterium]|nr:LD-carboxypeptidase [Flavobacteriales bacterium]